MLKLQDLIAAKEVIKIAQGEIEISKVDLKDLAKCLFRHQAVLGLLERTDVPMAAIFATAPDFVGEMICLALGGNPDTDIPHVNAIAAGDQLKLISRVFKLSFPEGLDDFFGGSPEAASSTSQQSLTQPTQEPLSADVTDPEARFVKSATSSDVMREMPDPDLEAATAA